jgi:hypothetical protein
MSSSGDGWRFSVYSATDHRAPVWIFTILSLIYATVFLLIRLAIKTKFWGVDDIVLGVAYV